MEKQVSIIEQIKRQGLLPLFYHPDKQVCIDLVTTLYSAGIRIIEFTNRGEFALENFKIILAERNRSMKDLLIAAGTIKTSADALLFIEAGTDFLISPVFDQGVSDTAKAKNILWIPGCMTPTEIHAAEQAGCKLVKLFPGNLLKSSFVSGIKELFPKTDFMPTGGVETNKENLEGWFASGVCAVGMGSKLISHESMENKDYSTIKTNVLKALEIIHAIQKMK